MANQIAKHFQKPWQLLVSVCVYRLNVISKELNAIEQRYASLQDQIEYEQSVLNDYEVQRMELSKITNETKTKNLSEKDEQAMLDASRELANIQDKEEIWANNVKNLDLKASQKDNTDHRLDHTLHYCIEDHNIFQKPYTMYPYTDIKENETLRGASLRLLKSHSLNHPDLLFLSNAPIGVIKIKYREDEERGKIYQGAKMFFTKALINTKKEISTVGSHIWLTSAEFQEVSHEDYLRKVKMFAL